MFDNLKDNEKLLLNAVNGMSPSFENATVRMLLATISELRARNIAVQEVKDECDGGVSDKTAEDVAAKTVPAWKQTMLDQMQYSTNSYKTKIDGIVDQWMTNHRGLTLTCEWNTDSITVAIAKHK